jgi:hypothetical protein
MRNFILVSLLLAAYGNSDAQSGSLKTITIKHTDDFELSGNGKNKAWDASSWVDMGPSENDSRKTQFKTLYSNTGIYFLFRNEDAVLTASRTADYERLWLEDVVEVFLWPDTTETIYFEYEISPLDYELPLIVPNFDGKFLGWIPWQYTGDRKIKHATFVEGGEKKSGSRMTAWYAEFFIPYALLTPLRNVPPQKGAVWRANMYRLDCDKPNTIRWYWSRTQTNFHQFQKFGTLIFE